jgi:hypothetical protein
MAQQQLKKWTVRLPAFSPNVRLQRTTFRVVEEGRRCLETSSGAPPVRLARIYTIAVT